MFGENVDRLGDVISSALVTLFIEGAISGDLKERAVWLAIAGVVGLAMILLGTIKHES